MNDVQFPEERPMPDEHDVPDNTPHIVVIMVVIALIWIGGIAAAVAALL